MSRLVRPSIGLLGQIVAILLLTLGVEFAASTFLYERSSRLSVRDEEAHRLAEHLVIARKLVAERPAVEREEMARRMTTDRYYVRWAPRRPDMPRIAPRVDDTRRQILKWEPGLENSRLEVRLLSPGRRGVIAGFLRLPDGDWLYFRMAEEAGGWDLTISRVVLALVPALALLMVGALLVRRTLRPMDMLARAAGRVGTGTHEVLPEVGTAEVRRVIHAFNEMQDRIHRLIADRTQALAAVGHDLRTPLARLQLRTDAIPDPALRDAVGRDLDEMEAMVASLLAYLGGEDDPEVPSRRDVAVMAATLVDDASDRGFDARYDGPDHLDMTVRPTELKRALGNLVENALHYGGGAAVSVARAGGRVVLAVEDDGPGIPPDRLADVLEPFIRIDTARARNTTGLGLGLAIVVKAVARLGGTLTLSNRPSGGLRAEISLPE